MTVVFHRECRANINEDVPLARYDHWDMVNGNAPPSGQPKRPGTPIWQGIDFFLPTGNYLLSTSGAHTIVHRCIPISGAGNYGLMANTRVSLLRAESLDQLPVVGACPDESTVIEVSGGNITNMDVHYLKCPTNVQMQITGGAYRVELWASAGGEVALGTDLDYLGKLGFYNSGRKNHFNVLVHQLP